MKYKKRDIDTEDITYIINCDFEIFDKYKLIKMPDIEIVNYLFNGEFQDNLVNLKKRNNTYVLSYFDYYDLDDIKVKSVATIDFVNFYDATSKYNSRLYKDADPLDWQYSILSDNVYYLEFNDVILVDDCRIKNTLNVYAVVKGD